MRRSGGYAGGSVWDSVTGIDKGSQHREPPQTSGIALAGCQGMASSHRLDVASPPDPFEKDLNRTTRLRPEFLRCARGEGSSTRQKSALTLRSRPSPAVSRIVRQR